MSVINPRKFGDTLCEVLGLDPMSVVEIDLHVDLHHAPTVKVLHFVGIADEEAVHKLTEYTVTPSGEVRKVRRLRPAYTKADREKRAAAVLEGFTIEVSR